MGHIARRNGRWQAAYRGPDQRERTRTFDRKTDAQRWLAEEQMAVAGGSWVDPRAGSVTMESYVTDWLETKADVAPRTLINVKGRIENHFLPFFGPMRIDQVRPTHVRSWVAGLVAAGMAASTVKSTYLTGSQVFAQAVTDGLIARTPCREIRLPRSRSSDEQHFLSPEQVNALAAVISDRYRALIYLAAYGGLRAGELEALQVSRLNLLAGTVEVVESLSEVGGRLMTGPTKTGRRRMVPLPRFLCELLGDHIGRYSSSDGYVFTAARGGPIRHHNFMIRHFKPAVVAAGLPPDARFHDLRHTCAALLIANGRHMEEIKEHLGHSSIRVTSDRYGHLFPSAREAVADALDATYKNHLADLPRTEAPIVPLQSRSQGQV